MKRTLRMLATVAERMTAVEGLAPVRTERLLAAARGELDCPAEDGSRPEGGEAAATEGKGGPDA